MRTVFVLILCTAALGANHLQRVEGDILFHVGPKTSFTHKEDANGYWNLPTDIQKLTIGFGVFYRIGRNYKLGPFHNFNRTSYPADRWIGEYGLKNEFSFAFHKFRPYLSLAGGSYYHLYQHPVETTIVNRFAMNVKLGVYGPAFAYLQPSLFTGYDYLHFGLRDREMSLSHHTWIVGVSTRIGQF